MHKRVVIGGVAFACFLLHAVLGHFWRSEGHKDSDGDRVVVSAPVLNFLFGGDRYLAANLEVIRLASSGVDSGMVDTAYVLRAQKVVSELNPCHEDNYYLANGLLTWGGLVAEGNDILKRAVECRLWDGVPAFFLGVNLSFFERDVGGAEKYLRISAARWPENSAALHKMAIMLRVDEYSDARLALAYLRSQRDSTKDAQLREMLNKRVIRMEGLVLLRTAQRRYESLNGPMTSLNQLLGSDGLERLPFDPLGLGYELRAGRIELRRLRISGLRGG